MTQRIEFTIPGVPVGQPRHYARNIGGHARLLMPTKHPVNAFKAAVKMAAFAAHDGKLLEGPVQITIMAVFPRPKAKCWKAKPTPRYRHASKPDCDNVAKAIKDALTGLVWRDDSQVCRLVIEKWVASGEEQPATYVAIRSA